MTVLNINSTNVDELTPLLTANTLSPIDITDETIISLPGQWSYQQLILQYLSYGCRAFGGPAQQILMMSNDYIHKYHYLTQLQFTRVLALYSVLPGPEATELACYFGYLSTNSILGGLLGIYN